jgi:hypothetical protein
MAGMKEYGMEDYYDDEDDKQHAHMGMMDDLSEPSEQRAGNNK